jgi:hypothetical protein
MQTEIAVEETRHMLEQWGRWARQGGYNGGCKSILAKYCESGYRISTPAIEITDEQALRVDKAVSALGTDSLYHKIALLHFVWGKSGDKIAKILHMPRSSTYSAISSTVDEVHESLFPKLIKITAVHIDRLDV